MKRLVNLANFGPTLDKFNNEHDNLDNFFKKHQIGAQKKQQPLYWKLLEKKVH